MQKNKLAKKVLLIGWDAADWKVIYPLIQQGKMPTLAKFISEGVHGKIKTLDPPLSPMLWTSMATGYRADKHGITGFVEPLADNSGIRPVTSTSRKVKAIWNILHQNELKSNIVGWWPSNPAEPINGVMVSNLFQQANKPLGEEWDMPDGTIHPKEMVDILKELRVHPSEMTGAHITPFIPNIKDIDTKKDKRPVSVAKILAHAASIHAASTYLQRETEWDFMAVYHDAVDHFSHLSMKFHPPHRKGIPKKLYENYKDVVNAGYMFHDMMLDRTLQMVDDDTIVMIVSDHGFHSDHLRPKYLIKEPAAPAQEHSPYGIICMRGPGIKKGEMIHGASVLDVTPTLLTLFGLPVGENMEGKPLIQAFDKPIKVDTIKDWEKVEGECGMHPSDLQEDPWAAQEAMQQLIELGYIEAPDENISARINSTKQESKYYVARNLIDGNKTDKAIELLEELVEDNPREIRYGQRLAQCYLQKRKYAKCKDLIERLKDLQVIIEEEEAKLTEEEKKKKNRSLMKEIELPNYIDFVEGQLLMHLNRPKKAMACFEKVLKKTPNSLDLYLNMGKVCMLRHKWEDAQEAFIKALSIDDTNSIAHHGLGLSFLRQNNYEQALDELFLAIDTNYYFPNAHYHIGEALVKTGNIKEAAQAFEVAVSMIPGMTKAHKWLVDLYENELNAPDKAKSHKDFLNNNIKGKITIVSGLPRSGTSMMMQIIDASGFPVLTDKKREADNNNPKGYYEYEPVKKLMVDKSWLPNANGKAVKIIAQLLPFLPSNYDYKIIFMRRDMNEVLQSQQVMLGKEKDVKAKNFPLKLSEAFQKQLQKVEAWVDSQPNVEMLDVNYTDVLENTEEELHTILSFIEHDGNIDEMKKIVDKSLYRNKIKK